MTFKNHLEKYLDEKEIDQLISSFELESKHAALLNLEKMNDETFLSLFPHATPHPIVPHAYIYDKNEYQLGKSIYHELGCFYLQEPSAMVVSYLLNPKKDDFILDMCAAPGGKTIQASLLTNQTGVIISNDLSKERTRALVDNIVRLGLKNIVVTNNDFKYIYQYYLNRFDKIILDAPCSGSGMFRKDEKMIEDWSINKVYKNVMIQYELIDIAYMMLKPGGTLIYSTCSYSYEEDEEVIKRLLANTDAELIDINNSPLYYHSKENIGIHLFPHLFPGEGHYICLIKKPGTLKETSYQEKKILSNLMPSELKDYSSYKFGDFLFSLTHDFKYKGLNIIQYGFKVGELIKNGILYSHQLARCLSSYYQEVELTKEELNDYIKGLEIKKNTNFKGFILLKYQNIPVDFTKTNGEVIKNHYPNYLRKKDLLF